MKKFIFNPVFTALFIFSFTLFLVHGVFYLGAYIFTSNWYLALDAKASSYFVGTILGIVALIFHFRSFDDEDND